jgi:Fe-S-cluster containining protein
VVETRGVLRHDCLMCGGSCQGVKVPLLNEGEHKRIAEQAVMLGVEEPVVDGVLRRVNGRCVFLGDDQLCRIHAKWGLLSKPTVCRQYPLVATRVGDETRVGLDPGCFTSVKTWKTGPLVPAGALIASTSGFPDTVTQMEAQVLALLDGQDTVAGALGALTRSPSTSPWPHAFLERWFVALRGIGLHELLADPDTSPSLTNSLGGLAQALNEGIPPTQLIVLSSEAEAFALDAAQRMVWLRLCTQVPAPAVTAMLSLAGAVSCAWAHPHDVAAFGQALAGWLRAIRSPSVLGRLLPSPTALRVLIEG